MTNNEYGTKALKITLLVLLLNYIKHLSKVPTRARANDTCVMSAHSSVARGVQGVQRAPGVTPEGGDTRGYFR